MLGSPAEAYYGSATSLTSGFKTSMNDYIYDTFLNNKYAQIAKEASLSDYSSMEDILKSIGLGWWLEDTYSDYRGTCYGTQYTGWEYTYFRSQKFWNHNQHNFTWYTNASYSTLYRNRAVNANGTEMTSSWKNALRIVKANNADFYLYTQKGDWGTVTYPSGSMVASATQANGNIYYQAYAIATWLGAENTSLGLRPVITLKAGIKTNESADTEFLGQTCWAIR